MSCVCVWASVYVCNCHLRDRKKILLASKDKNQVLKVLKDEMEEEEEEEDW